MYADGYNNEKRGEIKIRLAIKDEDWLLQFRNRLFPNHDRPLYYGATNSKCQWCELVINSKYMSSALASHGCIQAKTFSLKFPYIVKLNNLESHFIRGVFDGDGSIVLYTIPSQNDRKDFKYSFSITGYANFVKEIQEIIVEKCNLGEKHKIIPYKGKDQRIGTLMFSGGRQCEIIREWLYYDSHICLERKKKRFYMIGTDQWRTFNNKVERAKINKANNTFICNKCGKTYSYKKSYIKDNLTLCYTCFRQYYYEYKHTHSNFFIEKENCYLIQIKEFIALIDKEDLEKVKLLQWHVEYGKYVVHSHRENGKKKTIYLQRYILEVLDNQYIKFKNGNSLDCRKENLLVYEKRRAG